MNNFKKKFIMCIILFIFVSFGIKHSIIIFAVDNEEIKINSTFGYQIFSTVEDNIEFNSYVNNGNDSIDKMRFVLMDLGISSESIEELSMEDLINYGACKKLNTIVAYYKINEKNDRELIDKELAVDIGDTHEQLYVERIDFSISKFNNLSAVDKSLSLNNDNLYEKSTSTVEKGEFEDSYMKMVFLVAYKGEATYKFSVDSEWITSPNVREVDSLGCVAQNLTVENSTRNGWIKYYQSLDFPDSYTFEKEYIDYYGEINGYENKINGNWYGSVMTFDLLDVDEMEYIGYLDKEDKGYTGLMYDIGFEKIITHYEYEAKLIYPTLESYFCASASYSHLTFKWMWQNPSIGISTSGLDASIGITRAQSVDTRNVDLSTSIHYLP